MRASLGRLSLLACVLAAISLVSAAAALGSPLPGSSYDTGDGNQDNALGLDWQGAFAAGNVNESPDSNDDCFVGGVKELTPNQWAFNTSAGGCTPGKSNLRVAFANPESAAATTFAHFAFFRNDTTGNTFLTFELNQAATSWTNAAGTTIPCRSNGDVLLSFEVGGSSLSTVLYRWAGDGSGPAACPNGAAGTFVGSGTIPAGRFQGAMNAAAAIVNHVNPGAYGSSFPANAFGEAAVDLPAVLQSMGASPCFGFLQMQVHSRSSSSISSAMIDYTQPVPVRLQSCSVSGTQYQDSNANGSRDGGEPGVAGVDVYADLDDDGARDAGEPAGTSGATGWYRILNVPAGSYKIRQVARSGWNCSAPSPCFHSRSLLNGGNSTGNDFGNVGPSTASGTAFEDLDADGVRAAGEPDLAGVGVFADLDADGVADAGEPAGTSDATGAWSLADIPAGTHTIRTAARAGWTCSAPSPCESVRTFSSGSTSTGMQFGAFAAASVAGEVFEDVDGDGGAKTAGDVGLAGWQVFVDANGNDTFDIGEPQTVTGAGGTYSFPSRAPGAYVARITMAAANWYCTRPSLSAAGCERAGTLTSGQSATGASFGVARSATVSGTKFNDISGNGIKDGSDGALAGFQFWVDYDNDSAHDAAEPSATSDAAGNWTIAAVHAGSWTLREVPNGAYACTRPSPCTYPLTLASNGAASGLQFGNFVSRSVSGAVFDDADADGLAREAGEQGLAGWLVYSDENTNAALDAGEPTSTSNSLGQYNLTGLANGNYRIRMVAQAGWTCSYPSGCLVTGSIGSGQSDVDANFGVWGPSSISGDVFEDRDADGAAREAGEAGLAGRVVYIDADNDAIKDPAEASATSGVDGAYTLAGVNPGTYVVRQVLPGGWTCSRPVPCSWSVATSAGSASGRDFASYTSGSVSGHVFDDADADGTRDAGESGIAGRTVFLDLDDDGVKDGGEPAIAADGSGDFVIGDLAPGAYKLRQVLPNGWTQSVPGSAQTLVVGSGATATATAIGSYGGATIAGRVFEDADFDGSAYEPGDALVSGRTVFLDDDGDGVLDDGEPVTATDGTGDFSFAGRVPGTYAVRMTPAANWTCAHPAICSYAVTVASAQTSSAHDFGTYLGATVAGAVFEDADADGAAREAGEDGIAGRRVYLDGDGDATRDPSEPTTLTDATGGYEFTGVTARSWSIRLALTDAFACDSPAGCAVDVTLTSGSAHGGADFGIHAPGSISGHLFTDRDNDGGAQVFGENDQPGRTVYADLNDDGTLDGGEPSATTDERGDYTLVGMAPGSHRIRPVLPSGWSCSTPSPCSHEVTLVSRQAAAGNDFSSWTYAELSGTYFEDRDGDGDFPQPGEPGIASRTVYVDLDGDAQLDGGEPTTDTDGDGGFAFANLAPGSYAVRTTTQPDGWVCSYPAPCSQLLTLEAGERAQDVNFGAWTTGTVAGIAYDDADASGTLDLGEAELSGRTIYADLDDDGTQDDGEPAATTAVTGTYSLTLDPGDHTLRQKGRAGWACTAPAACSRTISITSQGALTDANFGSRANSATVAGSVYEDADGDGTQDDGEDGRTGITVWADLDDDGEPDAGEPSAATGAGGGYELTGVDQGSWKIRGVPGDDWTCSAPVGCAHAITLSAGDAATGRDFATWTGATITGELYDDADGDGSAREAGDEPLAGAVRLEQGGSVIDSDTGSPATAGYAFAGVAPGTYTLVADLGTRTCSRPASCERTVTVVSGDARTGQDFGAYLDATAAGTVRDDRDGDGAAEAGEPGLALGIVWADIDGDGERDAGEPAATAAADGAWSITGLAPGAYMFRLEPSGGATCAAPAACALTAVLQSGGSSSTIDFAAVRPASIAGVVGGDDGPLADRTAYLDSDGDGARDGGEPTATTATDGSYSFGGLAPGAYSVRLDLPPTEVCTAPAGCVHAVSLQSGDAAADHDFGAYVLTSITGTVIEDADADGAIDGGETGLEGVRVYLDADGDGDRDVTETSTTTAANGGYSLTGLATGAHTVRLDAADAFTCSAPAGCAHTRTLTSGQVAAGLDFALWRDGAIAGLVFNDHDGDGNRSAGEPVRAGVTVFADLDDDGALDGAEQSALTAADGRYDLAGLAPAAYALRVVADAGWICTWTATCRAAATVASGQPAAVAPLGLHKTTAPAADDATTSGPAGAPQSQTLAMPAGGSITLLDAGGLPTLEVVIAGQGTYVLDPRTGIVTFTPVAGFSGAADAVAYRVIDADGASADATYTPTVLPSAPAAAPIVTAPPPPPVPAASAQAPAAAQAASCFSRRAMRIHWKAPRNTSLRRIRITVNGALYARLPGSARTAVIRMQGRPPQVVKVRVTAISRAGHTYGTARTFRTCRPHFKAPPLPTLRLTRR